MSNFLNLLRNEQIKLYAKKATWAMVIILMLLVVGMGLLTKFTDSGISEKTYGDGWQAELQKENEQLEKEMETDEMAQYSNPLYIEKNNFHLENDIKPTPYDAWQFVYDNSLLASLISLFTIIVAAGIVSNEFKWGTIKLLLIRPISRAKILLSKYVSVLIFAFTMLVVLLVFSWLVGAVLFGVNGLAPTFVHTVMTGYEESNVISEIVQQYGLSMVTLLMMASFAFMISTIFRSSGIAIGLAIFLMFAGNTVVGFLSKYEWAKYILFANTDLKQYYNGIGPMNDSMTLTFSIIVLAVYLVIFLAAAWTAFIKRDVAGN